MTIHPLLESDLNDVVRIEQDSYSAPWTRKMFVDELEGNPFASLFVCREAEIIVGHVCYWVIFEELHILNLAVSSSHRRRRFASALMTHTITNACAHGAHSAMLEVRASNIPATTFYTQIGFQQIALRAQYYSNPVEDAIIMRCALVTTAHADRISPTVNTSRPEETISG